MVLKGSDGESAGYTDHQEVWERLPWYVNGTLGPDEIVSVEGHLSNCVTCRSELNYLGQLGRLVHGSEDYVPTPSRGLKTVLSRIDSEEPTAEVTRLGFRTLLGRTPWVLRGALLAQAALILVLLSIFVGIPRERPGQEYRTLSDSEIGPMVTPDLLRVIFDEQSQEGEIRNLLHSLGGEIVGGPSPKGVYTLEFEKSDPSFVVKELRSKPIVRFAEWIPRSGR